MASRRWGTDGRGQDGYLFRQQHAPLWPAKRSDLGDRFAAMKEEYLQNGAARSNLRYGYVRKPSPGAA
jgi:hypothetical protein